MPRTARLKEHEGKTLPDLSAPAKEATASNGPDRDEFLFAVGHQKKLKLAIEEARAVAKKFRNHLKLGGFNLAMMDMAMKEADREDGTTLSNMRSFKRYCEFMGLPIGHQFTLFDAPQATNGNAAADLMAKAFAEGRERGVRGEFPDEQKWQPLTPEGQEHQRGWSEGQGVHLAKLKSLGEAMEEADKALAAKAARKKKVEQGAAEPAQDVRPAAQEEAPVLGAEGMH